MAYEPLVPHKYTVNMLYLVCVMFGGIWFCILFKSFYLNLDWFSHFKAMYLIWRRESTAKGTRTNTLPNVIHLQYSALMCEYVNNGLVYLRNMIFFSGSFINIYPLINQKFLCSNCTSLNNGTICASNNATFLSECHLKEFNCINKENLKVLHKGKCGKKETKHGKVIYSIWVFPFKIW